MCDYKSLAYHTGAKIRDSSKNSHFEILILDKIHNFKVSFFTKFTLSKSHFPQNSHFQSLIVHKIHIFQTSNSWFLDKKLIFAPVWILGLKKVSINPRPQRILYLHMYVKEDTKSVKITEGNSTHFQR